MWLDDQGSGAPNGACHLSLSFLSWKMGLWLMPLLRKCLSSGWHLGTVTQGWGQSHGARPGPAAAQGGRAQPGAGSSVAASRPFITAPAEDVL